MDKRSSWKKLKFDVSTAEINRDKLSNELAVINTRLCNYGTYKEEFDQLENAEDKLTHQENIKKSYDEISLKISELKSNLSKNESILKQYESQAAILKDSNCIDIDAAQCGFLKAAKEASNKLQTYYDAISNIKNELCKLVDEKVFLSYVPEKHTIAKSQAERYRKLSQQLAVLDGEKKSADLYEKQIKQVDESITSLNKQMTTLESEIKKLEADTADDESLEKAAEQLQTYEEQYEQLPQARAYMEAIKPQIEELQREIPGIEAEKAETENKISELENEISESFKYVQSYYSLKVKIQDLENVVTKFNRDLGSLEERLNVLEGKVVILNTKKNDIGLIGAKASRLQVLSEAFGQDGIPHQIIRDIIPELEASANEILGQMTGGRMRLEFRTERTLKSNKGKEVATLDILIIDVDNGELPYLSRSGGQKVRAALAVSFALAMVKASRVGLQLGMMFVDEPPFLDAEGTEAYCGALEVIHNKYPEMRIVAISHDENMKVRFPQQITIETTENGSKVVRG
jgi:exonuclease SbcC